MTIIASLMTEPASIAAWLVAGLASGWLIGKFTEEPSYGAMGDFVLGTIGGLIGGLLFAFFKDDAGFWGALVVAIGGAWFCMLGGRTVLGRSSE